MSLHAILRSRTILCAVPHAAKAAAVPATVLETHADATVHLDAASASLTDPAVIAIFK